jgi:hypothetical protein
MPNYTGDFGFLLVSTAPKLLEESLGIQLDIARRHQQYVPNSTEYMQVTETTSDALTNLLEDSGNCPEGLKKLLNAVLGLAFVQNILSHDELDNQGIRELFTTTQLEEFTLCWTMPLADPQRQGFIESYFKEVVVELEKVCSPVLWKNRLREQYLLYLSELLRHATDTFSAIEANSAALEVAKKHLEGVKDLQEWMNDLNSCFES